jgi:eukaryotic-like serine/threonine-protein kinase
MPLSTGARLGPYEIQSAIGAGGMGEVYKARDIRLDRSVAIRILPADLSRDPDRRVRFQREAMTIAGQGWMAAGLKHPRICALYDVGDHEGAMFVVMEYLAGQTLAQRLHEGPLPPENALTIASEIAEALSAGHRQGFIHGGLTPGNVMLTTDGAKLLDFCMAALTGRDEAREGVADFQYMAPERWAGQPADAPSDLWALGAIVYDMVAGERAFQGMRDLFATVLNPESLQPLTPPALHRLVQQCLARGPGDRPNTADDVANDLRGVLGDVSRTSSRG